MDEYQYNIILFLIIGNKKTVPPDEGNGSELNSRKGYAGVMVPLSRLIV